VQTATPSAKAVKASDVAPARAAYPILFSFETPTRIVIVRSSRTHRDTRNVNTAIFRREVTLIDQVSGYSETAILP
jgi:hypothetical protein